MAIRIVMLAGPFIDDPDGNKKKFEEAAFPVWEAGFFAFNPIANCVYMHGRVSEEVFKERNLWMVERADALLMLSGWQKSTGAVVERDIAIRLGVPVFESLEELVGADRGEGKEKEGG
jgi:nucleoside 2-deoxyribosyltransferase